MDRTIRTLLTLAFVAGVMWPAHSQAQTEDSGGAVFVMTNSAAKNEIISYRRNSDGSLSKGRTYATGGRGSGGVTDPLGSQGSLILANDRPLLLAVNAGSGTISAFRVNGAGLNLLDTVACGGSEPVAVAQRGTLVYVLNAGGASSVVGFRLEPGPVLKRISKTPAYLSAGNSGAASLSFSPDGQFLLVTEKLTNSVDGFHVQIDGTLAPITVSPSAGPGAFAVTFAPNGAALVAETGPAGGQNASAISSYGVLPNGKLSAISTSVPTSGAGTCWLEVTPNGKFVYTANSATSTISGFSIGADGTLTALSGTVVAALPSGSTDLDIAITGNGKFLYTLNSGTGTVGIFAINHDGSLTGLGDAGGLSAAAGYNGIAAN